MTSELTSKTIAELRDGMLAGEFTAREIADSFNAAVAGARTLNAYTVETPEDALDAADAADKARSSGKLPALAGICLSRFLCGLGLSSIASVVAPYAVSRPGESPFRQPPRRTCAARRISW